MPRHRHGNDEVLQAWGATGTISGTLKQLGLSVGGRSSVQMGARLTALGVDPPALAGRSRLRYTDEALRLAAAESRSVADVVRWLGATQSGGTHAHLSRRLKAAGIDTSHFTGQAHMQGAAHPRRRGAAELLVILPPGSPRPKGRLLRRALLSTGVVEECAACRLPPSWQGAPLRLDVDHVNGKWLDNRPANLRFLCPNCHTQTPTFGRGRGRLAA